MSTREGFTLAKVKAVAASSPLLEIHAEHLLQHAGIPAETLGDSEALRRVVWDDELYRSLSAMESRGSVRKGPESIYAVASAITYFRHHVFPKTGDADADALRQLKTIATQTRGGKVRDDALFRFYRAITDFESEHATLAGNVVQDLAMALALRMEAPEDKTQNIEVQMLLHYVTRLVFGFGTMPDTTEEMPTFPLIPRAWFTLSDPLWEEGRARPYFDRSLAELVNAVILKRGGSGKGGFRRRARGDPGQLIVPDVGQLSFIRNKIRRMRMSQAANDLCATMEARARAAAAIAKDKSLPDGMRNARTLGTRNANKTIVQLDNTGQGRFVLVRILRPLFESILNAFDGVTESDRTPMSMEQLKMVRKDLIGTANELRQLVATGAVLLNEKLPLERAHELVAKDGRADATYIFLASHDKKVPLEERLWRKETPDRCVSMSGDECDLIETDSEDEVARVVRKSDGRVLSAAGRAFAQRVGKNVLLVVYS